MEESKVKAGSLVEVEATRIDTKNDGKKGSKEVCNVAVEAPVTIDLSDYGQYTVLCTPDDKKAMALGFLYSEGMLDRLEDVKTINECQTDANVMRVKLRDTDGLEEKSGRNLLIISSCGICGSESMDERLDGLKRVGDTLRMAPHYIRRATENLAEHQVLFERSGGTHAIGLFNEVGEIVSFAEDIGRHNALDKAIGKCIVRGEPTEGLGAAMSGRISLEMVGKCARAGIEVICAVSAPTSLAIEAASRSDITILAFVRGTRATVFTGAKRIVNPG